MWNATVAKIDKAHKTRRTAQQRRGLLAHEELVPTFSHLSFSSRMISGIRPSVLEVVEVASSPSSSTARVPSRSKLPALPARSRSRRTTAPRGDAARSSRSRSPAERLRDDRLDREPLDRSAAPFHGFGIHVVHSRCPPGSRRQRRARRSVPLAHVGLHLGELAKRCHALVLAPQLDQRSQPIPNRSPRCRCVPSISGREILRRSLGSPRASPCWCWNATTKKFMR